MGLQTLKSILSVFGMGLKLGFSHEGKNIDAGCLKEGCWE